MICIAGAANMALSLKAEMDFTEANKGNKEAKGSKSGGGVTKRSISHSPARSALVPFVTVCQSTSVFGLNSDHACY